MDSTDPTTKDAIERTLDREVELLMSAVNLVARRGAPAATVAGLRLAEAAMVIARPRAIEQGVILEPLWSSDEGEATCDVRVRLRSSD